MKERILISCFILAFAARAGAQTEQTVSMPRLRLGFEAGMESSFGGIRKPAAIRESQSYYYDYDYNYNGGFIPNNQGVTFYDVGVKPEYSINKRIAVAAGVRFYFNDVTLDSDRDYFLWRVSRQGTSTDYVKVRNVSQKNYYFGIPLEVKIFPREQDFFVRHYFIVGAAFNFLVSSSNGVSFQNPAMKKYTSAVLGQIAKPNTFLGYLYGGFGLKIGRTNYPFGNMEIHFPVYMWGKNRSDSFARVEDSLGIGIQTSLQIPIFRSNRLTYKIITD